jgi:hypothetical protein
MSGLLDYKGAGGRERGEMREEILPCSPCLFAMECFFIWKFLTSLHYRGMGNYGN